MSKCVKNVANMFEMVKKCRKYREKLSKISKKSWKNYRKSRKNVHTCTDRTKNCIQNSMCTNNNGNFKCACNPGYNDDGVACVDVDECVTGSNNWILGRWHRLWRRCECGSIPYSTDATSETSKCASLVPMSTNAPYARFEKTWDQRVLCQHGQLLHLSMQKWCACDTSMLSATRMSASSNQTACKVLVYSALPAKT